MMSNKTLRIVAIVLLILTLAFIWGHSMRSHDDSKAESRALLEWLAGWLAKLGIHVDTSDDHPIRKLAHFVEFGVLGVSLALVMLTGRGCSRQRSLNCVFVGMAVALIDETIQIFSGRGSLVSDTWLDLSGALAGLLLVIGIAWLRTRKTDRSSD